MVPEVYNVHTTIGVNGDIPRRRQLAEVVARTSPRSEGAPVSVEPLDTIVLPLDDKNVPTRPRLDRYGVGIIKLPGPVPGTTPHCDELPVRGKPLDSMITAVGDEERLSPIRSDVDRQPLWPI